MKIAYDVYKALRRVFRRLGFDLLLLRYPRDFEQDGLSTSRYRPFEDDAGFQQAKSAVVNSIGSDYQIDWRTHVFLWAVEATSSRPGCFVELGTGRGWMFQFAFKYFGPDRFSDPVYLCDRFTNSNVDSRDGRVLEGANPYYAESAAEVKAVFAGISQVRFVEGDLPQSLDALGQEPIKFVHVDLNAAKPEVESLERLWPRLLPGALILLDDFGQPDFRESNIAMRDFAKRHNHPILCLPTGQGLIIKSS